MKKNIGWVTYFITSCDVCNNHWDAVVHMETFDSDTQVSAEKTFQGSIFHGGVGGGWGWGCGGG